MNNNEFKNQSFELIASVAKVLGNAHRLELLELLANGPKNVDELTKEARITFTNASQHLQKLKQYKLVKTRRNFTTIYYSLANKSILTLLKALHQTTYSQLMELKFTINDFRKQYGTDQASIKELPQEDYIMVDVRNETEFNYGHRKGAINIPYTNLTTSLSQLDKNKLIVAYCRGELCTQADEVVQQLMKAGFRAVRFEEILLTETT